MIKETGRWLALLSVILALVGAVTGQRLPACAQEDGGPYPCVWDGPTRGNRQGNRVVITEPQ